MRKEGGEVEEERMKERWRREKVTGGMKNKVKKGSGWKGYETITMSSHCHALIPNKGVDTFKTRETLDIWGSSNVLKRKCIL